MKLLPRKLTVVTTSPKLTRPFGTSVQYAAYIPIDNHLRFQRQHNRNLGELEKLRPQYTYTQITGAILAGIVLAYAAWCLFA